MSPHLAAATIDIDGDTVAAADTAGVNLAKRAAALRGVKAVAKWAASAAVVDNARGAAAGRAGDAGAVRTDTAEGTVPAAVADATGLAALAVATAVATRAALAAHCEVAYLYV